MQVDTWRRATSASRETDAHGSEMTCPLCRCKLIRQRRRPLDRLWSLVQPVKRYRCENFSCQWVGNIATAGTEPDPADKAAKTGWGDYTQERWPRRIPVAFIVHMVLVAVGVVFVFVYSAMEPTPGADDTGMAAEPYVHGWTAMRSGSREDSR